MKKFKTAVATLMLFAVVLSFCGCQLKKTPDETDLSAKDKLIGALITTESLNTFDFESYIEDNIGSLIKEESTIEIGEKEEQYQNRIYARLVSFEETAEDGTKIQHKEYVFEDINGFWIFDAIISDDEQKNEYTCLCSNGALSDVHSKISKTDESINEMEITANLYYTYDLWGTVFYMNPVYQERDGDVYCIEGMGYSVAGDKGDLNSDSRGSQRLADEIKINNNGEETIYKSVIEIGYIPVSAPQKVSFIFMNANNEAVDELRFSSSEVPYEIKVPDGVRYIILEEKNSQGSSIDAYGKGEENAEFICEEKDGICTKKTVNLLWKTTE